MTAEERKDIIKHIEILEKGIERELKKHYTKEENRQKKINRIKERLEFWNNRLTNI